MDSKIRITVRDLVWRKSKTIGSYKVRIHPKAAGVDFGRNRDAVYKNLKPGSHLEFGADRQSDEIDVTNLDTLPVQIIAYDSKGQSVVATATRSLDYPFRQEIFSVDCDYFSATVEAQLKAQGVFRKHHPDEVFACRSTQQATVVTTVSGRTAARFEICPVRPVFVDAPHMVHRKRPLPDQGDQPFRNYAGAGWIAPTSPLNVIPNPSVVPILPTAQVGAANTARLEVTYYHPGNLNLGANERDLEWRINAIDGQAAAKFYDPVAQRAGLDTFTGLKAWAYGVAEGEVLFELRARLRGHVTLVAAHRALVRPIGRVPYRVNILQAAGRFGLTLPADVTIPRSTPADVARHVAVANRYLYQAGIQLTPENRVPELAQGQAQAITHSARAARDQDSIFEVNVANDLSLTRNVKDEHPASSLVNYRPNVVNIVYLLSLEKAGEKGVATDFPRSSHADQYITDNGGPSHSWRQPTGVWPDDPHQPAQIKAHEGNQRQDPPGVCALLISDICGSYQEIQDTDESPAAGLTEDALHLNSSALSEDAQHLLARVMARGYDVDVCWKDFATYPEYTQAFQAKRRDPELSEPRWRAAHRQFQLANHYDASLSWKHYPSYAAYQESYRIKRPLPQPIPITSQEQWNTAQRDLLLATGSAGPAGRVSNAIFGQCIAHELAHVLNVRHRNMSDKGDDEVTFPPRENIMFYDSPFYAQNIDLLQAKLMHLSTVVRHDPPPPQGVPQPQVAAQQPPQLVPQPQGVAQQPQPAQQQQGQGWVRAAPRT